MKHQERAQRTRQQLIEAAVKCFAEQGYDGTGVAMICKRAKVSKGAFYHHFDTKQAIFLALMAQWLEGLDHQLDTLRTSMKSVPEGLRSMTGLLGTVLDVGGDQLPMYLEFWSRATRDPKVWQETIAPFHRYHAFFGSLLRTGMDEGSIREVNADHAARVLVAFAVGLLMQGLLEPEGANWVEVSDLGMDMLMKGMMEAIHK